MPHKTAIQKRLIQERGTNATKTHGSLYHNRATTRMAGLYEQRSPTMCLWLCLTSAWLLFYVLRSIILKVSSTAIIERDKRRSVRFQKGVRYLTRSQLIDLLSSYFGYNVKLFPSQHLYLSRLLAKWV